MKLNEKLTDELTILYVNEDLTSDFYINLLKENFTNVITTTSIEETITLCKNHRIDLVVTDLCKKDTYGLNLVREIKNANLDQSVIIKAKQYTSDELLEIIDLQVNGFLVSPNSEEFVEKVYEYAQKFAARKKNIERRIVLQNILDHQSGMVILTDFKTISYSSKSFLDFFDFDCHIEVFERYESILDMFIKYDDYLHATTKEEFLDKFKKARALKKVVLLVGKNFTPKAFHLHIDKVEGYEDLYILSLVNISIIQEKNIEISQKAYVDGLTGVNNRNKFEETFDYEFARNKRYESELCVAVLDIDHFKRFNDTYGHLIGDEVLVSIAQLINSNVRKTDFFARWGGEEFVLLMPETNIENARDLCEKLRGLVESAYHKEAGKVTCSFGVTKVHPDDEDLKTIFERCDKALYNAKANGRNRVELL